MSRNFAFAGATDVGLKRSDNQDCHGKFPRDGLDLSSPRGQLFIIADGMGGHIGGKEASSMAVSIVQKEYFLGRDGDLSHALRQAMEIANEQIHHRAKSSGDFRGMGTTCTALVMKDKFAYVAHVGDSRAYRITESTIEQLTRDHTKVAEMHRLGILSKEEARNHPEKSHLTRALGIAPGAEVDLIEDIALRKGDHFLLCTDGLAAVEAGEMQGIVLSHSPQQACQVLIELANQRGGADNVTVMVVRVDEA